MLSNESFGSNRINQIISNLNNLKNVNFIYSLDRNCSFSFCFLKNKKGLEKEKAIYLSKEQC